MTNPNSYAHSPVDYEDDYEDNDFEDNEGNPSQNGNFYNPDNSKRHPKKRKLESFVSNYAFAPRSDAWSEDESFVLLDVWGERYSDLGRRSLRGEDWVDVTEKVAEMSGRERTEAECRSQLDVLKNKYKKEMVKVGVGNVSKWVFFKKMDALLNLRTRGYGGLGCGLDSGEYVFMNPRVYLDRSNVVDEMRDSPGQSDEDNEDEGVGDDNKDLSGDELIDGESARLLANSIQKFGEVYEKIEESKRRQMVELETMRQDFQRELELQKKQIVERAQAEIAKMREVDEDDEDENTDTSVEN